MKITGFETIRLGEFPNLLWLHIHTDEGLVGLGETFFGPRAVEAQIHETVAPLLLGKPALEMDRHGRTLQTQYLGFSGSGVEMRAASAVDIALWDLFGQAMGQPLHQCLGGLSHERMRIYNTCAGYRYIRAEGGQKTDNWGIDPASVGGPYEDLDAFMNRADELAHSLLEQGIMAMKIWPFDVAAEATGGRSISAEALDQALVPFRKIRDAVGGRMDIMAELHSLWTPLAAERVLRALAPYDPFWVEDPIKMINADLLAGLRARTGVPICASETIATRRGFREFLQADAVDVVMLDLSWCGGIGEAKKIATLAEAWGRPVAPHDCTGPVVLTASVHLSLNCPNTLVQETVRAFTHGWYREVMTELPDIRGGFVYPMAGAGLGTRLQPERLAASDCERRMTKA
ncbi:MAG: mandelate racemase/muconate lactonizing enzyme family protein [Acidisphaera sp.]|nr:mandelate racemase/muconate lactonizing enzyme family protein [Acidisphaera sp.]